MNIRIFFFVLTVFLVGCSKQVDEIAWDMPTPYVDSVFLTQNIHQFAKEVQESTKGFLTIRVHSGASLYKLPEIKRAVRSGQVPIGEILISTLGNESPLYQIDVLPLLATSYDHAEKLWQVSRPEIQKILEKEGLKLLFAVPWPPQGLFTKKELKSMADMKGLKVRSYNAMLSRLIELIGGLPTTVQTPEIPQAFSTGIIDSMMTSPSTGVSSQAWDYVKYYYDFQAWIPKDMVLVNQEAFDALPKEVQAAVLQAAAIAEERGWEMSKKETDSKLGILKAQGVKIMEPTEDLRHGLGQIRQLIAKEWKLKMGLSGEKVLATYQQLIDEQLLIDAAQPVENKPEPVTEEVQQ